MLLTMPFGKHRGERLSSLPDPYIGWLSTLDDLWPALRAAVEAEIARRVKLDDAERLRAAQPDENNDRHEPDRVPRDRKVRRLRGAA